MAKMAKKMTKASVKPRNRKAQDATLLNIDALKKQVMRYRSSAERVAIMNAQHVLVTDGMLKDLNRLKEQIGALDAKVQTLENKVASLEGAGVTSELRES